MTRGGHVELRWSRTSIGGKVAVARLYAGPDEGMTQVTGTLVCSPEFMNLLDRLLREGADTVEGATYTGREFGHEDEAW